MGKETSRREQSSRNADHEKSVLSYLSRGLGVAKNLRPMLLVQKIDSLMAGRRQAKGDQVIVSLKQVELCFLQPQRVYSIRSGAIISTNNSRAVALKLPRTTACPLNMPTVPVRVPTRTRGLFSRPLFPASRANLLSVQLETRFAVAVQSMSRY